MLIVKAFEFNPFQENTYVLYDETKECVVVDAGCYDRTEQQELTEFIKTHQLQVKWLINTHAHIDHVLGLHFAKETFKAPFLLHEIELPYLRAVKAYAPNYGFHLFTETEPDGFLKDGEPVQFGNQSLDVIFTPGHSPGHVVFYHQQEKIIIGGDVLFLNSIGRTDLPGGDFDVLIESIHTKLFTLPDDVRVFPGHGPATTLGHEKRTNPFCALTTLS